MNNVCSILLGLFGWGIPCLVLWKRWKWKKATAHVLSLSACALALCFQILEAGRLVYLEDWSALLDTWDVVAAVSLFLWGTTVALNLLAMRKRPV